MASHFVSILASEMKAFMKFKQNLGHPYAGGFYRLLSFDRYVAGHYTGRGPLNWQDLINGWLSHLPARKAGTVSNDLSTIRQFCLFRRRFDPGGFVPDHYWAPKKARGRFLPEVLTGAQVVQLLKRTRNLKDLPLRRKGMHALICILYSTGLRLGEAYRDALRLFLPHVARKCGCAVDRLSVTHLQVAHILSFLEELERQRANSIRTRNCRLIALRCFFKHALRHDPDHAEQYSRILAVAPKKAPQSVCVYLEPEQMKILLDQPDQQSALGARDYALMLFLYNTGARVSEALAVRLQDLNLQPPRQVRLRGKGQKERIAPLWAQTASALKRLLPSDVQPSAPVFLNQRGQPLTRHGVLRLVRKYSARVDLPQSFPRRCLHPHLLRHSCAVALLQAGIDITVIRDYLGHASVATTNRYVSTNLKMKRDALTAFWRRAGITKPTSKPWNPGAKLLDLLRSL